jgi:hypothetical protein
MRRRLVRVALVVVVMSAVFAGSAIARNPGPAGFPLVPAVQATVKDECTGAAVPNLQVSISDGVGGTLAPTKLTTGAFQFASLSGLPELTGDDLLLSLSALGYQSLGDPASPNPGVTVLRQPGPSGRVTKAPGPVGLPGQTRVYEGSRWAISLMPQAGCALPRQPKPATFAAKFFDLGTGAPLAAGTVNLVPNTAGVPAPAPIPITNGQVKASGLACGAYTMNIDAPGYASPPPNSVAFIQHGSPCDAAPVSGTATISTVLEIVVPPFAYNQAPQIDTITGDSLVITANHLSAVGFIVYAHDPDPGETALLTYNWTMTTSTGVSCFFPASTIASAAVGPCTGNGTVSLKVTVTDPHGASASEIITAGVIS